MADNNLKNELKDIIGIKKDPEKMDAKIFYDDRQYTIRIPARFGKGAEIDSKKDVFEFELRIPDITEEDERPQIIGRLKRG